MVKLVRVAGAGVGDGVSPGDIVGASVRLVPGVMVRVMGSNHAPQKTLHSTSPVTGIEALEKWYAMNEQRPSLSRSWSLVRSGSVESNTQVEVKPSPLQEWSK